MTSAQHLPLKDTYDSRHRGSLWDSYDSRHRGSLWDSYIAKFDPSSSALVYATYFGSDSETISEGIAVDTGGNIYLTGSAYRDFQPHNSPIQDSVHGVADAFIAKFSPDGAILIYAALLGGSNYGSGYRY
jgi:hypothetical protein